jgi:hypothetical protein
MKTNRNNFANASALQITFSIALILVSAILLVSAVITTPILGNYPDTSIALSTDTTVTPDAPPTNTTRINVSTSTDFNGTLAGDPTTGVVRVTDAHPAGTYTVTVTAFDNGGEAATRTFALTVTTPVICNRVSFAAATNYSVGDNPFAVAVGDFNGDGKQDLATANYFSDNVSILLGDGAGNFSSPTNFSVDRHPESLAVGDFNGDGKQDLAVGNSESYKVSILLGDGTGNFSAHTDFYADYRQTSVAVGDFNGDGKQDLATANNYFNTVSILLGDGTGNFSAPTNLNFAAGTAPSTVAVGDFNRDGKQDLAVANIGIYPDYNGSVSILLGDGTGNFSSPTNFAIGDGSYSVAVGDFNGDGKQDLAVGNYYSFNVSILLGDGAGNFSAPTSFPVASIPFSVVVGDFNNDGKQDLAVTYGNNDPGIVSVLLGDGAGNFSAPTSFPDGGGGSSVAVGDFNGDGKQDLAVTNRFSNSVSILLGDCPALVSQITPAETTCSEFSSGTAETLGSVQYDLNNDLIQRILPRNFLYWVAVTAPAGDNTLRITQTITTGNFNTFFAGVGHGTNVFDSNCVSLERTGSQIGNTTMVRFNAPAAGTYYIGINFSAQSLLGQPPPSPTTVHYDFRTIGVPDSTSGLDLMEHE